ncbi:MAG: hypothetical protein AAGI72_23730 [Pseudomonadota bacterium]
MPAPPEYFFDASVLIASHTQLLALIDAGNGQGKVRLYDDSDVLLCEIALTDPAGSVNGATGQLTVTQATQGNPVAGGTCTYGTVTDSDNNVRATYPVQAGTSAVSGFLVINSVAIVIGVPVTLAAATFG